jgi:hypothetical protein
VSKPEGGFRGSRRSSGVRGGVDHAVERFGAVVPGGQHADVIDHDRLGATDPGDGASGLAFGFAWLSALVRVRGVNQAIRMSASFARAARNAIARARENGEAKILNPL